MSPILKFSVAFLLAGEGVSSFSIGKRSANTNYPRLVQHAFSYSKSAASHTTPTSTTALDAIPTSVLYPAVHILGGVSGAPIVGKATKSWYNNIPLPSWTPPNFVFGPVWTLLYGLMGVSVSRVVKAGSSPTCTTSLATILLATRLWGFHYALNLSWAPVFFGFKRLRLGLIINFILIATLGYILPLFYRIDPLSAYLQIPYLLWLLYATKLNQAICALNPTIDGRNRAMILADWGDEDQNDEILQYEIQVLQADAAKYAGL